MRVLNRTRYPTDEIRELVRRELLRAGAGVVLVLERPIGDDRQGHVRYRDRRVRIWIAQPEELPYSSSYEELAGAGAFPTYTVRDWREDLVASAAHEAWHLRRRDPGDPDSELAAERHAIARLELYRSRRPRLSLLERIRELV